VAILFIGAGFPDILLLDNASALPTNPVPTKREHLFNGMESVCVWRNNWTGRERRLGRAPS
jgi:hypothetical protein